ncbi:MAG: J domain-containing protein [Treponema sp.]|jgi:hypothetical protein|nr:J domain-containing protein [Treponema sp.]
MGIWDRLGKVIENSVKDFIDDDDAAIFGQKDRAPSDPDFDAAFDELNDYLNQDRKQRQDSPNNDSGRQPNGTADIPEALRPDFAELGVDSGASAGECKAAYKRLLKIHHPDRHAGHAGNFKKATDKTARINAAYDRIETWRKGQQGSF